MDTASAVEQYGHMVYRLAYAQLRSRHDADDVFQEVFLRYHRAAPPFESEEHRKAWFLRVTANCSNSLAASPWRKRRVTLEDVYAYDQPEESGLDAALAQLPSKYRAVIHLYYYEGYNTEETARILRRRPSTVRAQLTRARQALARLLKEDL
ncbi:MAG: sigma-70 family RNA polymerase sigma factor [Oscillibacter sp.]|nr:sigma-70 family RNA polymerase sigma factor [uncultured Oscillibacter sp.]MCI8970190.1 sigma-70 family RNA polymerase sigma factor [Oscillibacter sp.]